METVTIFQGVITKADGTSRTIRFIYPEELPAGFLPSRTTERIVDLKGKVRVYDVEARGYRIINPASVQDVTSFKFNKDTIPKFITRE